MIKFLGYSIVGDLLVPAVGTLRTAEQYGCGIITIYDDSYQHGKIEISGDCIIGGVYKNATSARHNPDGCAEFVINRRLPKTDNDIRNWYYQGRLYARCIGFDRIDPAHYETYVALGYKIIDHTYIARYSE